MYDYDNFKSYLKKRGSKNYIFVKIRSPHNCYHCSKALGVGTECLTINPKMGSRRWYCAGCVQLRLNVAEAQAIYDSTAFDDEGAGWANLEALEEAEAMLYEAKWG